MGNQRTFASMAWSAKGKVTRRERFLAEMDAVIPWARLLALIEPHYPKAGQGRQPLGLEKMLRIYFLQQWFNLSDPQAEDAIYDSESMRRFARVELGDEVVPDETTILRFRHLLEQHQLTERDLRGDRRLARSSAGLLLRSGTIVDATIIAAPSSTKNASCDPRPGDEADQQGQELALRDEAAHRHRPARHRAYRDGDRCGACRHHSAARAAAWAGARALRRSGVLERGRPQSSSKLAGLRYRINRRPTASAPLSERWRMINRARSRTRACGEHAFRVVKQLWGFTKVRYRGLAKNLARAQTMFALANLYQVRYQLLPPR